MPHTLDRRQLHRLVLAAAWGVAAGASLVACGGEEAAPAEGGDTAHLLREPHVCRGLNTCKGLGAGGSNACAGQGDCASVPAHTCAGQNECAGQGGCASTAGRNDCSGKGDCSIPLMEGAWTDTRAAFEEAMTEAGREFGAAPPKG